jgi:antitoxin component YwqK of YwqJK toxin-antitoxin module|tara:strand:+ start:76 stop:261 length:186 start_codon:yes stop_codon:yes gene_type:complete
MVANPLFVGKLSDVRKNKSEGNVVDGKKEGKSVGYFFESGKVKWEENYVDGRKEGILTVKY